MASVGLENLSLSFEEFVVDPSARRLLKSGQPVRIQDQPFAMLLVLLEKPGEVVTRETIRQRLWPEGTYVDFDNSLNAAMNKLREALDDSADSPRFVETLPRRGYRFICTVRISEPELEATAAADVSPRGAPVETETQPSVTARPAVMAQSVAGLAHRRTVWTRFWLGAVAGVVAVLLISAGFFVWQQFRSPTVAGSTRIALAVLPFKNLSGDPAQDVFTQGLTEEMITQLGKLQPGEVDVVSSSGVEQYRGSARPVTEIGRELGVGYVIEGGVRREGNRFRITAQLVRVNNQLQVFAQTYESDAKDALDVQQDIASRIAHTLQFELLPSPGADLGTASPSNPAVNASIHGRYFLNKRTPAAVRRALEYFQQAIAADPAYAPAHAGVAECYLIWGGRLINTPPKEAYQRAREATEKALELDPSLAEAHASLAVIRFEHDWDFAAADREFRRAIELKPDYAIARQWYAQYLAAMGRYDEALVEVRRALQLEPFSRSANLVHGMLLMYSRDYGAAAAQFRKLIEMEPDFLEPYAFLNRIYLAQGKEREFAEMFLEWASRSGFKAEDVEGYRRAYQTGGVRALLRERQRVLMSQSDSYYRAPYIVARIHALLGENDQALLWIERALRQRDDFISHINVDPEFDKLRADPRFQQLLKRIGLPEKPTAASWDRRPKFPPLPAPATSL